MILALLVVVGLAAEVEAGAHDPAEAAYQALVGLDPDAREAVIQRLVDEGRLGPTRSVSLVRADARALSASVEDRLAAARTALRRGRADEAVHLLHPVREDERIAPFYREAVDEHVYAERELAGRWFRYGLRRTGDERRRALQRSRQILARAAERHADSIYADAVVTALARVDRSLDESARRLAVEAVPQTPEP